MVNKKLSLVIGLVAALGILVTALLLGARGVKVAETRSMLGTQVTVTVITRDHALAKTLLDGAFEEIGRLERVYSDRLPESELSRINRSASGGPVNVSPEMAGTLDHAFYWHQRSGGRFDITVGELGTLWGLKGEPRGTMPAPAEVQKAAAMLGMRHIRWDHAARTVQWDNPHIRLDLGGIAKLEILRKLREFFESHGQHKYLVNLGGDVLAGQRGELVKWHVGISDPADPLAIITRLELEDSLVLTSGDYFRGYAIGDERVHHILDPKTGYPAKTVNAATLVMPAIYPDPMPSIVAFLLGKDGALDMIESLPMVEGLVYSEGKLYRSSGFSRLEME